MTLAICGLVVIGGLLLAVVCLIRMVRALLVALDLLAAFQVAFMDGRMISDQAVAPWIRRRFTQGDLVASSPDAPTGGAA